MLSKNEERALVKQAVHVMGNQTKLGELVGVNQRTISKWASLGVSWTPKKREQILDLQAIVAGDFTRFVKPESTKRGKR